MLTARQTIELFHLLFLRALATNAEDKRRLALKGGCNLRFYFGSIRYSEDADFDVAGIAKHTLENRVDRLLAAPVLTVPLRAKGVELVDASKPKQTATTQRWKVGLRAEGIHVELRTKIEFSRRDAIEGAVFEATSPEIVRPYGVPAILSTHYATGAAIAQKVGALAGRTSPQARDVFDLHHLFARTDAANVELDEAHRTDIGRAIDNAMGISFDEFTSQVVAYLEPLLAEPLASADAWNALQTTVVTRLEDLSRSRQST